MLDLYAHTPESLADYFTGLGESPRHAKTVLRHFYKHHGSTQRDPDWESIELSRSLRRHLASELAPVASSVIHRSVSDDGTVKLLLNLQRGGTVECVLMPSHRAGEAACCVSSQVGCAMSCDFCASTRGGLERNLTTAEIVEQFLHLQAEAESSGRTLRRLVFMGMGEPMHNLEQVRGAIDCIAHSVTGRLGWRRISVSTVGIVSGIEALSAHRPAVGLAVSLHAPDDATRRRIVPTTKRYSVRDIMDAARRYYRSTDRIVNIEYCLLAGVNDTDWHAAALAELIDDFRAHVNLIPYNPVGPGLSGVAYQRPSAARVARFLRHLQSHGVVSHVRQTRGQDVNAACGQLRDAQRRERQHGTA